MAFIVCTTCGEQVSDTALECPACGTPTGVEPPERPKRWKYALVVAGVVLAAGIIVLIARQFRSEPVAKAPQPVAAKPAQEQLAKPPQQEVAQAAKPEAAKPPQEQVAKAPQQEVAKAPPGKNGVYFLAGYASAPEGREQLREIRPVVAQDESAVNEVMKGGTGAAAFRPLGLACGPEREPYYAWVYSRGPAAQPHLRGWGACGYTSLMAAALKAMEVCRASGGCQSTDAEIQLYAADVRDGAGEEWRAKPRIWCQFAAGSIVSAWQYGPQKMDFNSGCASLL